MKKVHTNKGFTMAELLIVVAIIAILVAIAIPTFKDQMERAREGVDLSALRNGYTEATAVFTTTKDTVYGYNMTFKQTAAKWAIDTSEFPADGGINDLVATTPSNTDVTTIVYTRTGGSTPGIWDSISVSLADTQDAALSYKADKSNAATALQYADLPTAVTDKNTTDAEWTVTNAGSYGATIDSDGKISLDKKTVDAKITADSLAANATITDIVLVSYKDTTGATKLVAVNVTITLT